jgi:hypothetical protein
MSGGLTGAACPASRETGHGRRELRFNENE